MSTLEHPLGLWLRRGIAGMPDDGGPKCNPFDPDHESSQWRTADKALTGKLDSEALSDLLDLCEESEAHTYERGFKRDSEALAAFGEWLASEITKARVDELDRHDQRAQDEDF